tara:strand:+ start:93 stop:269 length:177 start_codon:yes stop_codon:yes gene_type:complete
LSEVVWSINIMIAILLVAVGYVIYWVFKYDDWNPNPIVPTDKSEHTDTGVQDLGIGAE